MTTTEQEEAMYGTKITEQQRQQIEAWNGERALYAKLSDSAYDRADVRSFGYYNQLIRHIDECIHDLVCFGHIV